MSEFADEHMESSGSWLSRRVEEAFRFALLRAYESAKVHPESFLEQLQRAYGVEAESYNEMFSLPIDELDAIAHHTLRSSMKLAGAEGAGFGLGGFATVVPDMGILAMITMRTVQKLSLVYGFEYNTDEEVAELWIAAGTAAGVDIGRELLERTVLKGLAERVVGRMAARFSAEFAEKMVARTVPILSSAVGGVLNYYFVRAWGRRALNHFRQRHLEVRSRRARGPLLQGAPPLLE
jgi:EcsC family protein